MHAEALLQLFENRIAGGERRVDRWIEADDDVLSFVKIAKLHQFAPDLQRDRRVRLDSSRSAAVWTRLRQRSFQRLPHAFARHLDQTEFRNLQDLRLRSIFLDLVLQRFEESRAVLHLFHVDEVEDDDSAEVAQANLSNDFFCCFEIRFEHRLFEIFLADVLARVHVDRHERFGLIDDDVAARLQPHFRLQRLGDFVFDSEFVEDRFIAAIQTHTRHEIRLNVIEKLDDALILLDRIDPHGFELGRKNIANRAQHEIEIVMND